MPNTPSTGQVASDPITDEIRACMARTRTTQRQLADAASERLGRSLPQSKLNERLNNRTPWRLAELRAIADVFGLRLSELVAASEREHERLSA